VRGVDKEAMVGKFAVLLSGSREWEERGGGVRSMKLIGHEQGSSTFATGITELEPGAAVPMHYHNCGESVTVLEGVGTLELPGDELRTLHPLDSTWVDGGVAHRFLNSGVETLRILWIYASLHPTRTLLSAGVEVEIGGGS
jgi:putative monooxygenase